MYMTDQTLVCSDCKAEFVFTASEQEFFQEKGFSAPRRCKSCRTAAKAARGDGGGFGGSRAPREREMHDVVCASCGTQTRVPFKPTGERPVYCRDCFQR